MIPTFEKFLYPFLLFLKDGEMNVKELRQRLIEHFNLSAEDVLLRTRNRNVTQVNDRIGWARQYFRRALFIDIPQKGVYRLTERGRDYLSQHDSLGIEDLMRYPEFAEYKTGKPKDVVGIIKHENENLTPHEQMELAYDVISNDLADQLLDEVKSKSPQFFENLVVKLLVAMGYGGNEKEALVTRFSHDDGIDGIIKEDKFGFDSIYIQAKRYISGNVQKPDMHSFLGTLDIHKATKGIFITTSSFSNGAIEASKQSSRAKIVLIDGKQLADYMIQYNVGVSVRQVYEIKRIDSDFFEEDE